MTHRQALGNIDFNSLNKIGRDARITGNEVQVPSKTAVFTFNHKRHYTDRPKDVHLDGNSLSLDVTSSVPKANKKGMGILFAVIVSQRCEMARMRKYMAFQKMLIHCLYSRNSALNISDATKFDSTTPKKRRVQELDVDNRSSVDPPTAASTTPHFDSPSRCRHNLSANHFHTLKTPPRQADADSTERHPGFRESEGCIPLASPVFETPPRPPASQRRRRVHATTGDNNKSGNVETNHSSTGFVQHGANSEEPVTGPSLQSSNGANDVPMDGNGVNAGSMNKNHSTDNDPTVTRSSIYHHSDCRFDDHAEPCFVTPTKEPGNVPRESGAGKAAETRDSGRMYDEGGGGPNNIQYQKYKPSPTWFLPADRVGIDDFHENVLGASSSAMRLLLRKQQGIGALTLSKQVVISSYGSSVDSNVNADTSLLNTKRCETSYPAIRSVREIKVNDSIKEQKMNTWRRHYSVIGKSDEVAPATPHIRTQLGGGICHRSSLCKSSVLPTTGIRVDYTLSKLQSNKAATTSTNTPSQPSPTHHMKHNTLDITGLINVLSVKFDNSPKDTHEVVVKPAELS